MKKVWSLILCLALVFALAVSASAEGGLQMTLATDHVAIFRGESLTLTIDVTGEGLCDTYGFSIPLDEAIYEITQVQILDTNKMYLKAFDHNGLVVAYTKPAVPQGTVCKVTLQIKKDAPLGETTIQGTTAAKLGTQSLSVTGNSLKILVKCPHEYSGYHQNDEKTHMGLCTACGQENALEHTWDAGAVTVKPTCTQSGTVIYTCTGCQQVKVEELEPTHVYDHGCDPNCNLCGAERAISHQYSEDWQYDADGHYQGCTVCGAIPFKHAHTPDRSKATEENPQLCSECGYIITPMEGHAHNYLAEIRMDALNHWYDCDGCMEKDQLQAHVYDNACDATCNTCGYTRAAAHVTDDSWFSEEENHYRICQVCGQKVDVLQHAPGEKETELTPRTCLVCSRELSPALGHTMSQQWYFDEQSHYHMCVCGEIGQREAHIWSDHGEGGFVSCTVCGAQKEAVPMGVWIAMGAALLAAISCIVAVLIRKKKKVAVTEE